MPTSVPNFNFLAPLVTEIWRGSQNKKWALLIFPDAPIADKFLYRELLRVNAYKCAKFQLPGSISFRDKEVVLKFNMGATTPLTYPVRWKFCVLKVLGKVKQRAKFQHRISMHHAVMRICISRRLSIIMCPKMFFGVLRVKMWNYCLLTPQKALPCVNTRLLIYRMTKSVQRPEL